MNAKADLGTPRPSTTSAPNYVVDVKLSAEWEDRLQTSGKRLIDMTVAGGLLILFSPLFLLIAILVKLSSTGPIFYRWRVVGQNGTPFTSYKFRSMVSNADQMRSALQSRNEMSGPVFKLKNDPRITSVGSWLRKFSLDELPQLWSVVKGDMSLVGPRPPLQSEYALFTPEQKLKLSVKPGITCLWQVSGRNEIKDFSEWVRLDLRYIETWSLLLDLKILLLTIPAVILGKGR
jgi:lipopolysaccharide/colanic/teichoic acid biosynthesis glycosyltransferase